MKRKLAQSSRISPAPTNTVDTHDISLNTDAPLVGEVVGAAEDVEGDDEAEVEPDEFELNEEAPLEAAVVVLGEFEFPTAAELVLVGEEPEGDVAVLVVRGEVDEGNTLSLGPTGLGVLCIPLGDEFPAEEEADPAPPEAEGEVAML